MKKRMVSLLLVLVMVLAMFPISALAAANSITVTDAQYYDSGALKSVTAQFGWDTATATGRMVLQTKSLRSAVSGFPYGDFTDMGVYGSRFNSFDEVLNYDTDNDKFGIIAWSDETDVGANPSNTATFNFEAADMPLEKNAVYYVYFWTWYQGHYYPDNLILVIQVKDGVVRYTPATGRNKYNEDVFEKVVTDVSYSVAVTPGANMARVSGDESQTELNGAMTPVIYTAAEGYEFPEDYGITPVNGIKVRRDSASKIVVLGTPTADAAITLPAASAIDPTVTKILNDGWPYGKNMTQSSVTLTVAVSNAESASYQWQTKNGDAFEDISGATAKELILRNPASGSSYRCVVNGTLTSEAVTLVKPDSTWTKPAVNNYYITNGTMAYMVNGTAFDVVGSYTLNNTKYMANTSYNRSWQMYSSSDAEPSAVDYSNAASARLDDLQVAFDKADATAIYFRADLADGQQAFSFGCDAELADGVITYDDRAALVATVNNDVLQQIAMIGAKSADAASASDASFVIAANGTPVSKFWVGYFNGRKAYGYNTFSEGSGYKTTNIGGVDVTTSVEGTDSGMTMSWLNVPSGGVVKFQFKVGKVVDTGATEETTPSTPTNPSNPASNATVTFHANGYGTAPAAQTVTAGETVAEPAAPTETGYTFGGWYTDEACTTAWDFAAAVEEDLDLYAKWTVNVYNIIYHLDGGEIKGQYPETYTYGVTEQLPAAAQKFAYLFRGWLDVDGNVITEIPAGTVGDVVVTAKWILNPMVLLPFMGGADAESCSHGSGCPLKAFSDLDANAWYHDGIHFALDEGLMNGTGDNTFSPNAAITRGMVVTILYRVEGAPAASVKKSFSDVSYDAWYGAAVSWAAANGIVNGYDDGTFRPNAAITREQLAAILGRYAAYKGDYSVDYHTENALAGYPDAGSVSGYAVKFVNWAVAEGLINGMDGKLNPAGTATRAQAAAILYRYLAK